MRRGKRWIWVVLPIAVFGGGALLRHYYRRPIPVSFANPADASRFLFPDEIERKALIDLRLPWGSRLVLPERTTRLGRIPVEGVTAGYLRRDVNGPVSARFFINGEASTPSFCFRVHGTGPLSATAEQLIELPYAIEERYRKVRLDDAGREIHLTLPVTHAFGSSKRKVTEVYAGGHRLIFTPRPWKLASMPITFDVAIPDPGKTLLFERYNYTRDRRGLQITQFTLGKGDKGQVSYVPPTLNPEFEGKLYELEPVAVTLESKLISGSRRITLNGKPISLAFIERAGFKAIEIQGRWFSTHGLANKPRGQAKLPLGKVEATAYRVVGRWPIEVKLDLPVMR